MCIRDSYYILFDRLMAYWERTFPGRILQMSYESLVAEQEQNTRLLLSHCGLAWDEACRRFEKNAAPVTTASAVPVSYTHLDVYKRQAIRSTAPPL